MASEFILGIHLGFTCSEISVNLSNKFEIMSDTFNKEFIPNYVNFPEKQEEHKILCGSFAKRRYHIFYQSTIYDITFMLGRQYDDQLIQEKSKEWLFKIEKTETGGIAVCMKDKKYEPYELAGELLKNLAEIGNSRFPPDKRTNKVVVCIPNDLNEQNITSDIMRAAEYASLNVINIITEPVAAAFAYQLNLRENDLFFILLNFNKTYFEISLLKKCKERIILVDIENDKLLGGKQFIDNTVQTLIKEIELDDLYQKYPRKMFRFRKAIYNALIELNEKNSTCIIDDDEYYDDYELTLEHFEEINKNLIDKITNLITKFSRLEKIDMTILAGKFSSFQFIKRKIREITGKEAFYMDNLKNIFALGTANFIKCADNFVDTQKDEDDFFINIVGG